MTRREIAQHIAVFPSAGLGEAVIRGTRIAVSSVLDYLADGVSEDELLRRYPQMTSDDIRACLAYAATVTRQREVSLAITF